AGRFAEADLAHQLFQAQDWAGACYHSRLAGDDAARLSAPAAVETNYTRALLAAESGGLPVPLDVLRGRGKALEALGELSRARADYELGLHEARQRAARESEWQSLVDLGFVTLSAGYTESEAYFTEALTLAEELGDPRLIATSFNRVGNWALNTGRFREALDRHRAALGLFEQLD